MSVTTLAELRGRVAADISDDNLQTVIDRCEARIIRAAGDPVAERTDRFVSAGPVYEYSPPDPIYVDNYGPYRGLPAPNVEIITLKREPSAISAIKTANTDAASADPLDPDLYYYSGNNVYRANCQPWLRETLITWTPVDFTDEFIEATIDLVRLRLARSGYKSERNPEWQYTSPDDWDEAERAVIARLAPESGMVIA